MADLTVANYGDLVNATKINYGPNKIQQMAQGYVGYPLFTAFFKEERMTEDGGQLIQRNLWPRKTSRARFKGIGATDTVKIEDITAQAQVPWRFADTHWGFVDQDIHLCKNAHQIIDLIDLRRKEAFLDYVEMFEAALWQSPATTDTKTILGVPHFVVTTSASTTFGFNGSVPSGYTTVANINPTTYPNWKNGNVLYTSVTKTDLLKKMRTGFRKCQFQNLEGLTTDDYRRGQDRYLIIANETVVASFEDIGEAQNESLGRDLAVMEVNSKSNDIYRMDGVLTFRRKPIIYSQHLDGVTGDPVYALSMDTWCMYVHDTFNNKETEVLRVNDTHDSYYVAMDTWCNLLCIDRRRNFVCSTS